jgi:hypothetical protein
VRLLHSTNAVAVAKRACHGSKDAKIPHLDREAVRRDFLFQYCLGRTQRLRVGCDCYTSTDLGRTNAAAVAKRPCHGTMKQAKTPHFDREAARRGLLASVSVLFG